MAVTNSWNYPLQSQILLCSVFFYFVITLYYFPLHANALSFNLTDTKQMSKDVVLLGYADVSNEGIEITPKKQGLTAGRASYRDPLRLWDKASGNLTDFKTYFKFVIDSQGSLSFGDGFAFFLLPYNFNSSLATGAAMGLPILSIKPPNQTTFVAVEFDTYANPEWDSPNDTTHVGIDINSITSNATELVTIGFSAATGGLFETHTVKSWSFNSSLQIGVPGSPSPSPSPSTNPTNPSTNSSPSPNAVNSGIGKKMSGGIDYQIIFFGWLVGFAWLYVVGK